MADFGVIHDGVINAGALALYMSDVLVKGLFSGIGKDLWEDIKSKPKKNSEIKLIKNFEEEPAEKANIDKMDFLFEQWLEEDTNFKEKIMDIFSGNATDKDDSTNLGNKNKNVVIHSNLSGNSGTLHIGDK